MTLTDKQQTVLNRIKEFIAKHGYSPTSKELGDEMDFSQSAAMGYFKALTKKGAISRTPGKSRTIAVL